jgi:deaminated glutathione amidase
VTLPTSALQVFTVGDEQLGVVPPGLTRVAAAQYGVERDVEANRQQALAAIDQSAVLGVKVLVLPEFCNHAAWYDTQQHAWSVALDLDGSWLQSVARAAAAANMFVQVNVSRRLSATDDAAALFASNVLVGPALVPGGSNIIAVSDKSVLMGNENTYFTKAASPNPVVDLPIGRVGLYACMEGVVTEPPRHLALQGAALLLNSLNSFALDEASLHVPVRAAENGVWVVAACKIGPLVPSDLVQSVADALQIPVERLRGAGESQIVTPDGNVLVRGPLDSPALVIADIDISLGATHHRADGTDARSARRPELYARLGTDGASDDPLPEAPDSVVVAVVIPDPMEPATPLVEAVLIGIRSAAERGARLIVLPELAGQLLSSAPHTDWGGFISAITGVLSEFECDAWVATSIMRDGSHCGVIVNRSGVVHEQLQLHTALRLPWMTKLGAAITFVDLPIGRVVLIVGDDLAYPEVGRIAAILGAHIIAAPIALQATWEDEMGMLERSAENRVNLVAASATPGFSGGIITSLPTGMTLWAQRPERPFDGTINIPNSIRISAVAGITLGTIRPANAANKIISRNTDLVQGRPWRIAAPLLSPVNQP